MPERYAIRTRIAEGRIDDYLRIHTTTPLELDDDLRSLGVLEWRIWRHGNDLFHEILVADRARFRAGAATSAVQQRWGEALAGLVELAGPRDGLDLVWELPSRDERIEEDPHG